jgi:DNA-binding NarL/FixJ family response regulator
MARARLVMAADQPLLLEAFSALLEPEFDVVATVTDIRELFAECGRLKPNVALVDTRLSLFNVIHAGRQLRRLSPSTRLVLLANDNDLATTTEAVRAGAGYVLKSANGWELKRSIRAAVKRPAIAADVAPGEGRRTSPMATVLGLTARQLEVLRLLVEGRSMKEAAALLDVTPRTIAFHKYKMMGQLHVKTTAELVQFATKHGVLGR